MANGRIGYQISAPTFSNVVEVYSHTGVITNDSFTIQKTGWYLINLVGFWGQSRVKVDYGNGNLLDVAIAQITTSNISINVTNNLFLKAGTELLISIGNDNGSVKITDIT